MLSRLFWLALFVAHSGLLRAEELPFPREVKFVEAPLPSGVVFRFGSSHYRHPGGIGFSVLSADGKKLVTTDRTTIIWDIETGKRLHVLSNHPYGYWLGMGQTSLSPNNRYLAQTSSYDVAVKIWDLQTGKLIRTFGKRQKQWISHYPEKDQYDPEEVKIGFVRFINNGKELLIGNEQAVYFYDYLNDKVTRTLKLGMRCTDVTPDGKRLSLEKYSGRKYHSWLYDTVKEEMIEELNLGKRNESSYVNLRFSDDGKWLLFLGNEGISLRETKNTKGIPEVVPFTQDEEGWSIDRFPVAELSPDHRFVAWAFGDQIILYDRKLGKRIHTLDGHVDSVHRFHFRPDSKELISTSSDGTIRRWNVETGKALPLSEGYSGQLLVEMSADGKTLVIIDESQKWDIWDIEGRKRVHSWSRKDIQANSLGVSPDGTQFATAHNGDAKIHIWDSNTGKETKTFSPMKEGNIYPYSLHWESDGKHLLGLIQRQFIRFNMDGFKPVWETPPRPYLRLAISESSQKFWTFSGSRNTIVEGDLQTGKEIQDRQVPQHPEFKNSDSVVTLAASPDGRTVVCGQSIGRLHFWDTKPLQIRGAIDAHRSWVRSLCFTPDNRLLISTARDEKIQFIEAKTLKILRTIDDWYGYPEIVGITPNGKQLVIKASQEVFLWNLKPDRIKPFTTFNELWKNLQNEDGPTIEAAIWTLAEHLPQAFKELQNRVKPESIPTEQTLTELLKKFESNRFNEREKAEKELSEMDLPVLPFLQKTLEKKPSADVQERLQKLIQRIRSETRPQDILNDRILRAVEFNGSTEAKTLLKSWSDGAAEGRFTKSAKESLTRLERNEMRKK
jgi:WD40 repeat protein